MAWQFVTMTKHSTLMFTSHCVYMVTGIFGSLPTPRCFDLSQFIPSAASHLVTYSRLPVFYIISLKRTAHHLIQIKQERERHESVHCLLFMLWIQFNVQRSVARSLQLTHCHAAAALFLSNTQSFNLLSSWVTLFSDEKSWLVPWSPSSSDLQRCPGPGLESS